MKHEIWDIKLYLFDIWLSPKVAYSIPLILYTLICALVIIGRFKNR